MTFFPYHFYNSQGCSSHREAACQKRFLHHEWPRQKRYTCSISKLCKWSSCKLFPAGFLITVMYSVQLSHGKFCTLNSDLFYSIHTTGDSGRNLQGRDFVTPDNEEKGLCQQDCWQVVSSLSFVFQVFRGYWTFRGRSMLMTILDGAME